MKEGDSNRRNQSKKPTRIRIGSEKNSLQFLNLKKKSINLKARSGPNPKSHNLPRTIVQPPGDRTHPMITHS